MEISGYSTFKQIVSYVLIDKYGEVDNGRYHQVLAWLVRKYIDMRIHLVPQNKPVEIAVQSDPYCIKLPRDYVSFRAVGINRNGEFLPFDPFPEMSTYVGEDCGSETQGTNETQEIPTVPVWYTYKLDEDNQRVLLQGYPYLDTVILLYVSTGVSLGGDTVVPAKIVEVLISWIHYMLAKHAGIGDVNEAWATHVREVMRYEKTKFNLDSMYAVLFDVANNKNIATWQ